MAANSNPVVIGSTAPDFTLPDPSGKPVSLRAAAGRSATLIAFLCNHCPYVIHIRDALVAYARDHAAAGVQVIAISSNDVVAYPADSPEKMAELAPLLGFPYLYDESQSVARAYDAACTPDLYLYDASLHLYYHGRFDATRPGGPASTGADLRDATQRLLAGKPVPEPQLPSVGCSIK